MVKYGTTSSTTKHPMWILVSGQSSCITKTLFNKLSDVEQLIGDKGDTNWFMVPSVVDVTGKPIQNDKHPPVLEHSDLVKNSVLCLGE